ncbi:MAG: DUF2079 domain-containing protein [Candidatus Thermoplasmatota archaeon]|nr:DUF2079 domain-containing protein [Candidatus Thermoplasmatota archaeon]
MNFVKFIKLLRMPQKWLPLAIIAISLVLYNYFWDVIDADRILSLSAYYGATVFDMGLFFTTLWTIFHTFSLHIFLVYLSVRPIALVMSPLSLINNPFFFVYLQTFWISITVVPLYIIAYKKTGYKSVSLLLSISYLLFFGIAGQNWFDIHFQTLFVPLFVSGYALNLIGHRRLGFTLVILSGLAHFPYIIFSILFFIFLFIEETRDKGLFRVNRYVYVGLTVSIGLFIMGFLLTLYLTGEGGLQAGFHIVSGSIASKIAVSIDLKVYAIILLLFPFLCLPLLSKKWIFFLLVYFILLFVSGNAIYFFPNYIRLQYLGMIVPFLYIGTIEVLSNMEFTQQKKTAKDNKMRKALSASFRFKLKVAVIIFILIVLLGTVFEPYGPLNKYSSTDFKMNEVTQYNISLYDHYVEMVDLIPRNDPYVLYQNNMPQILYRDPTASINYLFGDPNNYTYFIDGKWTSDISYIIADPYSDYFTSTGSGNYSLNMYAVLNHYISTGQYGILAEYNGIVMLKKEYKGNPIIYGPENKVFTSQDLYTGITTKNKSEEISFNNLTNYQTLWYGPYTFMQPGDYILNLEVKASNISSANKFQLRFSYMLNLTSAQLIDINLISITGHNLTYSNRWENITLNIKAINFYDNVEFAGQNFEWNGNFSIRGITLKQISS